jgi:Asp-tRNA(Asn)/Glu-tRNA(Gln) amidotransferase A subunit family amidase
MQIHSTDTTSVCLQVVAAPHQDRLCLAVAEALEKDLGGWIPPPAKSSGKYSYIKEKMAAVS